MYGSERDATAPGPQPGRDYRELTAGPLDGQLIEVTEWTDEEMTTGAYLIIGRAGLIRAYLQLSRGAVGLEGRHALIG